jgi:LacI family transcriptional regulator
VVGAEREARKSGHGVLICSLDEEGSDAARSLRILIEHRVGGILTAAPQLENDKEVGRMLREWRIPAVSIHHVPGGGVSLVGSDHARTASLATEHLLGLGHRRIATITGSERRRVTQARLKGYERALKRAGISYDPALVEADDWEPEGGYRAALRLLDRSPDLTALFVQSDLMAFGALHALYDRGVGVPQECAVVGCDDIPMAAHAVPPLTTVHIPFYETGGAAVRLLLEEVAGEGGPRDQRVLLPVHLVCRASCGCRKKTTL